MAFYKAGKELADLHLNYEQGINEQSTGKDGDYSFYANIPMLAHRSLGVKVIGDIDIWQNEWADETYQYFAVEKMRFAKVRDENGKLVADKTRIITTAISLLKTFRSKPTSTSLMVSPLSTG